MAEPKHQLQLESVFSLGKDKSRDSGAGNHHEGPAYVWESLAQVTINK